jgi:exo beta-1,2-glucooligosaccharide sophorohydrolase (non-reducing end)
MLFLLVLSTCLRADTAYFQRVLFDNSLTPDSYYHSQGKASEPSTLELIGGRLPVETSIFHSGPNALRLNWMSSAQGGWEVDVQAYQWRNRPMFFPGDTLCFWAYSSAAIAAPDLPRIGLKDTEKNFTAPLDLATFTAGIPAHRWVQLRIPLSRFATASVFAFEAHRVSTVFFVQGVGDGVNHTLLVDDIRIDSHEGPGELPVVQNLRAKGFERHIDLSWDPVEAKALPHGRGSATRDPVEAKALPHGRGSATRDPVEAVNLDHYVIYRSMADSPFQPIGIQTAGINRFSDFLGKLNQTARYRVTAADRDFRESEPSSVVSGSTLKAEASDSELLDMVQEACFRYYWEEAHPVAGMARENVPGNDDIVATGASGFGIMALVVGVERKFVTREQGVQRLLKIVAFLEKADRFHGAWPHFLNGSTGKRMAVFGQVENGADLVETSFLMEGLLTARQYFKADAAAEKELYKRITQLWETVEWEWFRRTADSPVLVWHWSPEYSWYINNRLTGWNEVMITYLLAIASPTHGVPGELFYSGYAGNRKYWLGGAPHYGIKLDVGPGTGGPLFFTQYSFMGFDPHVRDRFTDYFRNNRNICIINRDYCIQNPHHFQGYGAHCWGITAVDGPRGYVPYEPTLELDDGTIAPTGAIGSFAYTPEASMDALKFFYRELGDRLWDIFGFRDAFNLQENWFSGIYMGLNQAPMVVMIENYRTGLIWKCFMANPEARTMLQKIGFGVDAAER